MDFFAQSEGFHMLAKPWMYVESLRWSNQKRIYSGSGNEDVPYMGCRQGKVNLFLRNCPKHEYVQRETDFTDFVKNIARGTTDPGYSI